MEGRNPPPKAEHPYPDNPDLNKLWGTPKVKALFKSIGVFMLAYGTLAGISMYITRHQKGPFGVDVTTTKEEHERAKELRRFGFEARLADLDIRQRSNDLDIILSPSANQKLQFDDGVTFAPPV